MNKNFLIGAVALVLVALVAGYWLMGGHPTFPPPVTVAPPTTSHPVANVSSNSVPAPAPAITTNAPPIPLANPPDRQAEAKREQEIWKKLFETPIVFYGKVVDEQKNPVVAAKVLVSPTQTLTGSNPKQEQSTDSDGMFSVSTHGVGVTIMVSKEGYYTGNASSGSFGYVKGTGTLPPHADPNDPAIFVLRKMGQTEKLIVTSGNIKIARDGTPVQMNLTNGHTYNVTNGDIEVQAWISDQGIPPNSNQPYDWRCKITVPGGGIQPRTNGEDFTAPDSGYQPNNEIDMSANTQSWNPRVSQSYFLQLENGEYARIDFTMAAGGDHFFSITSYLNPTAGHRNLEYNPGQTASQ